MSMRDSLMTNPVFPLLNVPRRAALSFGPYIGPKIGYWVRWLLTSKEDTNYTYDLTPVNRLNIGCSLATILKKSSAEILGYFDELESDQSLFAHVERIKRQSVRRQRSDSKARFGRRIAWYAVARALKPSLVIETGVDKGLGSVVLCAALLRNTAEGFSGRYLGTDINPQAGELLSAPYSAAGHIAYGDSIETLRTVKDPISLFVNDSHHSADYERREYETIAHLLAANSMIIGDNSHETPELANFSQRQGLSFTMLPEQPAHHWHPGAGLGLAWPGDFASESNRSKRT